jgi:hypothetical protein
MPLIIQFHDSLSCPTVICDWCQRPITNARNAGYFWRYLTHKANEPPAISFPQQGDRMAIIFLHKGRCDERYHAAHGPTDAWAELRYLPTFLARNLCMHRRVDRQHQCKDCGLDLADEKESV